MGEKGRRESLDRRRIASAALRVADERGIEGLTMRRLARDLEITPMALYKHFPNKEALLDGMVEAALAVRRPRAAERGHWTARARALVLSLRRTLKQHPSLIPLLARRPALGRGALRLYEESLAILRESGLSDAEVLSAYAVLYSHALGSAVVEYGRLHDGRTVRRVDRIARDLGLSAPTLSELRPRTGRRFDDRQFAFGLDVLLAGLEARARQTSAGPRR